MTVTTPVLRSTAESGSATTVGGTAAAAFLARCFLAPPTEPPTSDCCCQSASDASRSVRQNQHMVMTRDAEYLRRFPSVNRVYRDASGAVVRVEDPDLPDVPLWTDHFSSLNPIELRD